MQWCGGRGPKAEGIHAAAAVVHGCNGRQADDIPNAAVHGGRGAGKPDAGLGQRRGRGGPARGGGGCADGCNDGLGDGALPEVVVAVRGCRCAALAGLIQVEAHVDNLRDDAETTGEHAVEAIAAAARAEGMAARPQRRKSDHPTWLHKALDSAAAKVADVLVTLALGWLLHHVTIRP